MIQVINSNEKLVDEFLKVGRVGVGMRIALLANTGWYIYNFRKTLIQNLIREGYEVFVLAPYDDYTDDCISLGARHVPIGMSRTGVNVLSEVISVFTIRRALKKNDIDLVLSYTPKGNIYTAIATRGTLIKQFANISGLGRVFSGSSVYIYFVSALYRILFRHIDKVFFQNNDDQDFFLRNKFVAADNVTCIPGSGVNLQRFRRKVSRDAVDGHKMRFLMVSRIIVEKGVLDYVEAARRVRQKHPDVRCYLLGEMEAENGKIDIDVMDEWKKSGIVEYLGMTDDVKKVLCNVDCVVLPSYYREGVPRSLLEAASMSLPVITTDSVGCRDAVDDEITGILVPPRNPDALEKAMCRLITMPVSKRLEMGRMGRRKMEREFDENIVINRYLEEIEELSASKKKKKSL